MLLHYRFISLLTGDVFWKKVSYNRFIKAVSGRSFIHLVFCPVAHYR